MFEIFARCKDFRATPSLQFGCGYSRATTIFPNRSYDDAEILWAPRLRGLRNPRVLPFCF
jgi:hypothetical protein